MSRHNPFLIALATLEEGESHVELIGTAEDLEIDPALLEGPVVVRATFYRSGQKVELQAALLARARLTCDRCLEPIEARIDAPLRIFAERRESRDHRPQEEVREDDLGIVYHDGRFVDLTDEVRQELLVQIPWHVLCREDCRGLCPQCGADRNRTACACGETARAARIGHEVRDLAPNRPKNQQE